VSVDTGIPTMKIIDNFISNEEATTIRNYILNNEDKVKDMGPDLYNGTSPNSLTGRWYIYNWLTSDTCGSILIPKLTKELPNSYVRLWANIFRKGEGITEHNHGDVSLTGNLYLGGPEGSATHYVGRGPVRNKIGTIIIHDGQLDHWVELNNSDTPRVSMAFDIIDFIPNEGNDFSPRTFIPLGTHDD
tara:strand:+ start:86 stop:649 length:564 start_codon:yes stop_codon:yes gene_type:complete